MASRDGDFAIKFGGWWHVDRALHCGSPGSAEATDGADIRRARLRLEGRCHKDRNWLAETGTLTGESGAAAHRIDRGEFKRLTEAQDFSPSNGIRGARELAARYARIDLNDGAPIGGDEEAFTAALNWYLNTNLRLMFDYSRILDTDESNAVRAAVPGRDICEMRVQSTF